MRFIRYPFISLLLMSCAAVAQSSSLRDWESLYEQTLKTNETKALGLLQQKYRVLPAGYEKLYISSKLYNFMNKRNQPFHGGSDHYNNEYKAKEDKFIQALNLESALKFEEAVALYIDLLAEAKESNNMRGQELLNYQLCRAVNRQGEYYQASLHCSSLESLVNQLKQPLLPKYESLRVIANNYEFIGDYQKAFATYQKLLDVMPTYYDPSGTYNDVGLLLKRMGQLDQSSSFLNRALELRKSIGTPLELAQTYHSLGDLMISREDYESSIAYFNNAYSILEQYNHLYGLTHVELGLGKAYIGLRRYDIATDYLLNGLDHATKQPSSHLRSDIYLTLAKAYLDTQHFTESLKYSESALELATQTGDIQMQALSLKTLSSIYESKGDIQNALSAFKKYAELELTTFNEVNQTTLSAIDHAAIDFEQQMKLAELSEQNESKIDQLYRAQQQRLMLSLIIFVLIAVLVYLTASRKIEAKKASRDGLTGILNRAAIISHIKQTMGYQNHAIKNVLILLDLDRFKNINDAYGHPSGDKALTHVTSTIRGLLVEEDMLGRLGGEEFIILLRSVDEVEIRHRVEEIHHAIADKPFFTESRQALHITASFSFLATSKSLDDFDELYSILDQALYQAKQNGRNCIVDAYNDPISLPKTAYVSAHS